jgi:hypothetical protein
LSGLPPNVLDCRNRLLYYPVRIIGGSVMRAELSEGRREATGQRPRGIRDCHEAQEKEPQIWESSERAVHFDVSMSGPAARRGRVTLASLNDEDQE